MLNFSRTVRIAFLMLGLAVLTGGAPARTGLDAGRDLLLAAAPVTGEGLAQGALSGRPVIVTFFASWCPPCKHEFEALNKVRWRYPDDLLTIVAVNAFEAWGGKENPARMARFLKQTDPAFPVIKGSDEILRVYGNIERIPTLILFDAEGREVWRFVHEQGAAKMSATSEEILAALSRLDGT